MLCPISCTYPLGGVLGRQFAILYSTHLEDVALQPEMWLYYIPPTQILQHSYGCTAPNVHVVVVFMCSALFFCIATKGMLQLKDSSGSIESFNLQFQDILVFVTGATHPPPIGFQKQPKIQFHNDGPFPRANTCANTLILSVMQPMPDTDSYAYYLAFGILNTAGFGSIWKTVFGLISLVSYFGSLLYISLFYILSWKLLLLVYKLLHLLSQKNKHCVNCVWYKIHLEQLGGAKL